MTRARLLLSLAEAIAVWSSPASAADGAEKRPNVPFPFADDRGLHARAPEPGR